ncbi:MAG TPA: 6-bladed beta-propeller [Bacteroidetes bacterium]|nr:6-bladed beta-propeller [Bacteroidota bacterium]
MSCRSILALACLSGILLIGCSVQSEKLPDGKLPTVEINGIEIADLDPYLLAPVNIKLSQLAENIRVVPLETNPECMLPERVDFQIGEKYIIARNQTRGDVFQFSSDGSFIRKIIVSGSAPGEFLGVPILCLAEKEDLLLAFRSDLTYLYSLSSGSFLGSCDKPLLNPDESLYECRYLGDSLLLVSYTKQFINETTTIKCGIKIKTIDGKLIWEKGFDYGSRFVLSFDDVNFLLGSNISLLSTDNTDEYIIQINDQDTVYSLNTGTYSLRPRLLKRFEKIKIDGFPVNGDVPNSGMEEQEFASVNGYQLKHYIHIVDKADNNLLVSGERFFILYDYNTKQAHRIVNYENDFLGFSRDIDIEVIEASDDFYHHNLPVLSKPNGKLVEVHEAFHFLDHAARTLENPELDPLAGKRLRDITGKVTETSNPILLIGDMKKKVD